MLTRDDDVLDTWFSSALWPFSTLGWPDEDGDTQTMLERYYPGDVLVTGFDIIFFWVARMMMMGLHFMGEVPFKDIYMHALVRDAKGQKMSKSKGNVMDPLELTEKYGADALRFTLMAMAAQGRDIRLSEDRIEGYRNFATKLWNAARYCEMNGCKPVDGFDPATASYIPNQWMIAELYNVEKKVARALDEYRFNDAAGAIYHFAWGTFCDWYLEFTKPLLQQDGENSEEIRQVTGWVLDQIFILLNPFMPFITEELHEAMAENPQALISARWPDYPDSLENGAAKNEMDWLMRFISEIRSVRSDMNVPAGAQIQLLVKDANGQTQKRLDDYGEIINRMARIEKIGVSESVPKGAIQAVVDEATLMMPIADIIDLDQERARLKKEIARLEQDIEKISQKLKNKKFVENAPDEVVEAQKTRKADAEQTLEKLATALKQLQAA